MISGASRASTARSCSKLSIERWGASTPAMPTGVSVVTMVTATAPGGAPTTRITGRALGISRAAAAGERGREGRQRIAV